MRNSSDWVDIAIRLKNEGVSWTKLPEALYKITGERHTYDEIRGRLRRKMRKPDRDEEPEEPKEPRQGFDEKKPEVEKIGDLYIVTSGERYTQVTEDELAQLKRMYCQQRMTVNQVCRELTMARPDFWLIKTAFSITKDDVPFTDEEMLERSTDELIDESLQEKKRLYFIGLQQKEVEYLRKENEQYRKKDHFINKLRDAATEVMHDLAINYKGPEKRIKPEENEKNDIMLEIAVVDLHLSKLAWAPEVGENYDYKIAEKRYKNAIEYAYNKAMKEPPGKVLIPFGNDFFHTDTLAGTTTAGTPQDFDGRWQKQFNKGTEMAIWTVDRCSEIAPVELLLVPGNHDKMFSYFALMLLNAWFKDREDVTINTDPKSRKYVEFGKCLIGYTHGDKEKKRLFGNMQVEQPQAWGRTKYREFHTGHLHHEAIKEEHGVIARQLSTMTATDAYHFEHGYVGALQKSQSFLWHKNRGLSDIWFSPVE